MGFFKKQNQALKKIEEEKNAERKKKVDLFLAEYRALAVKHGLDIAADLNITQKGITPVMRIVEIEKPKEEPKEGQK